MQKLANILGKLLGNALTALLNELFGGLSGDLSFLKDWLEKLKSLFDLLGDIDIGKLPILPAPPQLPPLPSFIPSVEMKLPDLPPPPKIPQIIPQIDVILDIADLVGKVYCIVKGKIGLVGEKGVKSKIEQLTQRTRAVPWFDDLDLTPTAYFKGDKLQ